MAYVDNFNSLDSTTKTVVTHFDFDAINKSFKTDVVLPVGTPVKFDGAGKIVAATSGRAIGVVANSASTTGSLTVKPGYVTVQIYGSMILNGSASVAITAAGTALKFTGVNVTTGKLEFAPAATGETVSAIATQAATLNADCDGIIMLFQDYVK